MRTTDSGGIRRSVWLVSLALVIFALALFVITRPALQQLRSPTDAPHSGLAANAAPLHATPLRRSLVPGKPPDIPPARNDDALQKPEPPGVAPQAAPPVAADADSDTSANPPTGIALFPAQGTKPILRGIIVPDGVELPPGYVRHYQATYEGRQLPPILMFHPDYHPVDASGEPIPLPEDRVVPPDMAPPGMAIQMLEIPDDGGPMPGTSARAQSPPQP